MRATVVGSYPVPSWLHVHPSASALRDALLVVLKTQELAGLDVVSDGELSRFDPNHPETNGMIDYFVRPLSGVRSEVTRKELERFRADSGMAFRARPAGVVYSALGEGTLDLPSAWQSVAPLSSKPLKFTVTSPYMLARTLIDTHYHDLSALAAALAEILAEQVRQIESAVLQVDEANLTGHPEDAEWAHEPINTVLRAARGERAVHLCFGNYGGQTIQAGEWRTLVPFLNRLDCNHLLLEFARRGYDELHVLRDLRPGIALGVGVVDIKDNQVESAETIARRIELAIEELGPERIQWVHPDCGLWMLPRSVADGKLAALVAGRDLVLGRAVRPR